VNKARRPPFEVAQQLWRSRYPSARVLFCGGSVVRGDGYPLSDLDVVVLFDNVAAAWREERAAPDLYASIEQAFSLFFRTGERADLIRVVQLVLAPFGGEVFDGFRSEAPASSRTPGGILLR
jgi:predicted nucleotidyltransferase